MGPCDCVQERQSLAGRLGGCVPEWERKKEQALSRRTEEMSISNVPQMIFSPHLRKRARQQLACTDHFNWFFCVTAKSPCSGEIYSHWLPETQRASFIIEAQKI